MGDTDVGQVEHAPPASAGSIGSMPFSGEDRTGQPAQPS